MTDFEHITVQLEPAVDALRCRDGHTYVDVTAGGAGHSAAIAAACAPTGRLIAFDRDPNAVAIATERLAQFGDRAQVVHAPFSSAPQWLRDNGLARSTGGAGVDGLLADLGVSSPQIDTADRGFSIAADGPLDMRMSGDGPTAADIIDASDADELARIFYEYGEIRESRRLARAVKMDRAAGLINTTGDLAGLCGRVLKSKRSIHPATLPFQALRIAVNGELDELDTLLDALPDLLADGGRAVFISFHSLEDRRVKRAFRALTSGPEIPRGIPVRGDEYQADFRLIGRGIKATDDEIQANPRARSARMRVIERISAVEAS